MPDYALMNQCLYEGKAKEVEQMTKDALAAGRSVQEVLNEGLIAGMSVVGEDFKHNILYVPEVLIAARAMKAGMAVLKPLLTAAKDAGGKRIGTLLMGTVRGDLHDIGKNLVCMMAEGAGFEVHDIGVDQSVEKFMAAADKCNPDIIGMSALLTTTMVYMKTVIDGFEAAGRDVKFAVGGAPISQMFADEIGADGYGANASAAVDLFLRLALARESEACSQA
jgi:5-methyltetrahydrofolate--homocysteine methyltransferase